MIAFIIFASRKSDIHIYYAFFFLSQRSLPPLRPTPPTSSGTAQPPPAGSYSMHTNSLTIYKGKNASRFYWVLSDWGPFSPQNPSKKLTLKSIK
ncbi:hypothetical protein BGP_0213 [Beggiatoa sp. PS]|nr:hypothetical protein BGP_0213 [Beggiatoa sp. PS]